MIRSRSALFLAVPLVLAAGLLACGGKIPETRTWALRPAAGAEPARGSTEGARLGLARFSSSLEARSTSLTWREGDGMQVHRRGYDAWVDYPDRMLEQLVATRLAGSGRFASVTRTPPVKGTDGTLACRVVDFTELVVGDASTARVGVDWRVTGAGGAVVGGGLLEESEPASAKTVEAHVAAMQRASTRLADRLAEAASAALASPR